MDKKYAEKKNHKSIKVITDAELRNIIVLYNTSISAQKGQKNFDVVLIFDTLMFLDNWTSKSEFYKRMIPQEIRLFFANKK